MDPKRIYERVAEIDKLMHQMKDAQTYQQMIGILEGAEAKETDGKQADQTLRNIHEKRNTYKCIVKRIEDYARPIQIIAMNDSVNVPQEQLSRLIKKLKQGPFRIPREEYTAAIEQLEILQYRLMAWADEVSNVPAASVVLTQREFMVISGQSKTSVWRKKGPLTLDEARRIHAADVSAKRKQEQKDESAEIERLTAVERGKKFHKSST